MSGGLLAGGGLARAAAQAGVVAGISHRQTTVKSAALILPFKDDFSAAFGASW